MATPDHTADAAPNSTTTSDANLASQIGGTVEIFHEPSGIVCQVVAPSENVLGLAEAA
jgi:hypothetical protein